MRGSRRLVLSGIGLALRAQPDEIQAASFDLKTSRGSHLLKRLWRRHVEDAAATGADQMNVLIPLYLKMPVCLTQLAGSDHAQLPEEIQGAIDSGEADARSLSPGDLEDFGCVEMRIPIDDSQE